MKRVLLDCCKVSFFICFSFLSSSLLQTTRAQSIKIKGEIVQKQSPKNSYIYNIDSNSKLSPIKINNDRFEFSSELNLQDTFYIQSIVISPVALNDFESYVKTLRANKMPLKNLKYMIDTSTINLQLNLENAKLTQDGGKSNALFQKAKALDKEYENKGMDRSLAKTLDHLNKLNKWRCTETLLLIDQYSETPYARHLLNQQILSLNYELRDDIKARIERIEGFNPQAARRLWDKYQSFILANSPKNENMAFPTLFLFNAAEQTVDTILDLYPNEYLVIDFWATWCRYCIEQHPKYMEISKQSAINKKAKFISISLDKNKTDWEKYTTQKPLAVDSYWLDKSNTNNKKAINEIGITSLPRYMIINTKTKKVIALNITINDIEEAIKKL